MRSVVDISLLFATATAHIQFCDDVPNGSQCFVASGWGCFLVLLQNHFRAAYGDLGAPESGMGLGHRFVSNIRIPRYVQALPRFKEIGGNISFFL